MFEEGMIKKYQKATGALPLEDYRARRGNLLVISPHPDDDVLGAGGTMALAAENGRAVFSVYITDGRGSPRREPGISDEEMASAREREAIVSLKAVGAAGGFFLRRRSQELGGTGGGIAHDLHELLAQQATEAAAEQQPADHGGPAAVASWASIRATKASSSVGSASAAPAKRRFNSSGRPEAISLPA